MESGGCDFERRLFDDDDDVFFAEFPADEYRANWNAFPVSVYVFPVLVCPYANTVHAKLECETEKNLSEI